MNSNEADPSSSTEATFISNNKATSDMEPIEFFLATRIPIESHTFKWNLTEFCNLSNNKELYSPCIWELSLFSYKLKLTKYENGFGLFHVCETRNDDKNQTVNNPSLFVFGETSLNNPQNTLAYSEESKSYDYNFPRVMEYQVSIKDRHGRLRIKWAASFSIGNDYECCKIGEYRSNSWETFLSDMVELHCCLKVIKTPITERQTLHTEISLSKPAWQKLSEDLKSMYKNSLNADYILEVGTERILVNSSILSARSPVFRKMFYHNEEQNTLRSVKIKDVQLQAMKRLLEFLYTGTIEEAATDLTFEEVFFLYNEAHNYKVMDLQKMCGTTLMSKASVDNAKMILIWADVIKDTDLKSQVLNFIRLNFESVVRSVSWNGFKKEETKLANEILKLCV
ncbi:speckle-type POZ protein B [Trichonephila clavata]|uniref:Speckle-type POZ protein B n=1 Tax=Trichonephila clavata TaxID=2740835 RepID=A0A8X6FTK7_TRICU|nr:speckle-type POZ protein B [Trichonephila clavata]